MSEEVRLALGALRERRDYLTQRIAAKSHPTVRWDVEYDTRERDALTTVIEHMEKQR